MDQCGPWNTRDKMLLLHRDIEMEAIQGQRSSPLAFISPKGTLNPIDVEIRTIYGQRCGPIEFISPV